MRLAALMLTASLVLATAAASANAAPAIPKIDAGASANLVEVWGGCGYGMYPSPWGYCVPNSYGYRWYGPYGYRHWRHWR